MHPRQAGVHVKGICLQVVWGPHRKQHIMSVTWNCKQLSESNIKFGNDAYIERVIGCVYVPTRLRECSVRPRAQSIEGSVELDAKYHSIQANSGSDGSCKVDLFASHLIKQLPWFCSRMLDPEAEGVDAFNQDWSQVRGFANPPWCLISQLR